MCARHYEEWVKKYQPKSTKLKGLPETDRFWFYVAESDVDDCWIWLGALNIGGYGVFNLNESNGGGQAKAHRYAYQEMRDPFPDRIDGQKAELDHRCRVRPCVNPWHLQIVTRRGNILLGNGFAAENSRKAHCPNGHAYDEANTLITSAGWRACRTCIYEKNNRYQATEEFLAKRRAAYEPKSGVRGKGAYQKERTHCPKGHRYEGDNLALENRKKPGGGVQQIRRCRTCIRAKARR